jgi:hypothetical protein
LRHTVRGFMAGAMKKAGYKSDPRIGIHFLKQV